MTNCATALRKLHLHSVRANNLYLLGDLQRGRDATSVLGCDAQLMCRAIVGVTPHLPQPGVDDPDLRQGLRQVEIELALAPRPLLEQVGGAVL